MKNNLVVFTAIVGRSLATIACVSGATYLAFHGKEGWGWLIFLGLCIGCYSVSSRGEVD